MIKYVIIDSKTNLVLQILNYEVQGSIQVDEPDYTYTEGYGKYLIGGKLVDIADTDTASRQGLVDSIKANKDKKSTLDKLTVTIGNGKVFYADAASRADIADAINIGIDTGATTTTWKLAEPIGGSKLVTVTMQELKEARALALQAKGAVVGVV